MPFVDRAKEKNERSDEGKYDEHEGSHEGKTRRQNKSGAKIVWGVRSSSDQGKESRTKAMRGEDFDREMKKDTRMGSSDRKVSVASSRS